MTGAETSSLQNETLIFSTMYFGVAAVCYVAVAVCMPALIPAIFLTVAFACGFIAVLSCQPMIHSRLLGGDGIEHMVLVVRRPESWNFKSKWPFRWFMKDEGRITL